MEELSKKQVEILRNLSKQCVCGEISLNKFIQQFEGVLSFIDDSHWKESAFSILVDLEELNAVLLDANRPSSEAEKIFMLGCFSRLDKLIKDIL